jgi:hypothetical protein
MAGGFFGVVRHQGLALLMVDEGRARGAEKASKLGPGTRLAHVDDASRFYPRLRRFDPIRARGFAGLNVAPGGDSRSRLVVWLSRSRSVPSPLPATMKGAYTEPLSEAI